MKIVQITTFSYKAAGNIMMNLHNTMREKGIESYVVWGRGRKAKNKYEYFMNDNIGVKIHGLYTRLTDRTGFASTRSTKKMLKWIDRIEPDIIHLHCVHGYYLNIQELFEYIKKKNIRVVWTQHDCWAFTGHCAYFDACGCDRWESGCYKCKQLNTYPASKFIDSSTWNWNKKNELFNGLNITIVTPCKWLAGLVRKSFLGNYPIRTIYNGIDINVFKPTNSEFKIKKGISDKKIILGVASEWTERKGLKDFIKLKNIIGTEYVIVLVGITKKQMEKIPDDIITIERTNNISELVEIYSAADVFFNPTYEDNFPTTNLEALACGTPVVTYNTGGSLEVINEYTGAVVEKGNVLKSVEQFEKIISLKNSNKSLLDTDYFTTKAMISKYMELYNE